MQCEIRGMSDISEAGRPPPDSLPKRGRVNEVCREWLVHEDGALAYKLQKEEVEQHYTGNKSRNAVVRLDTPLARSEQQREQQEALAKHHQRVLEQEQYDAEVARRLAERIQREDEQRRLERELRDAEIARQLQVQDSPSPSPSTLAPHAPHVEREAVRLEKERKERVRLDPEQPQWKMSPPQHQQTEPPRQLKPGPSLNPLSLTPVNVRVYPKPAIGAIALPLEEPYGHIAAGAVQVQVQDVAGAAAAAVFGGHFAHTPPRASRQAHCQGHGHGDVNAIGLPPAPSPEDIAQHIRQLNLSRHPSAIPLCDESPSSADIFEEEARRLQEEKDAEFARLLQEEEEREGVDALDRDRLMAIEAQDEELARMLQEREKAKLRRARERAKQKALLKKQQEQEQKQVEVGAGPSGSTPLVHHQQQSSAEDDDGCYSLPHQSSPVPSGSLTSDSPPLRLLPARPSDLDISGANSKSIPFKGKKRFPDPEAIEEIPLPSFSQPSVSNSGISDTLHNIAIVIDPTYPRRSPVFTSEGNTSTSTSASHDCPEEECNSPAPPYMPIQGQRRTSSLEKKAKKKGPKDGCKQQ